MVKHAVFPPTAFAIDYEVVHRWHSALIPNEIGNSFTCRVVTAMCQNDDHSINVGTTNERGIKTEPGNCSMSSFEAVSEPSDSCHSGNLFERLHHALYCRMRAVLHFDPILAPTATIWPIAAF